MKMKNIYLKLALGLLCAPLYAQDFETFFNLANEQFKKGNSEDAIINYKKSVELNPSCQQAWLNFGLVYTQQNKHDEAVKCFEKAVALDANYVKAHIYAGSAYQNLSQSDKALTHLSKAIELQPSNHDAFINIGRIYSQNNDFEKAIFHFNQAAKLKPKDANILLELANTMNMCNQIEESLALYYKILELIPGNSSILYNIAYTLKKLGRIEQAMPFYQKVLEQEPTHSEAHFSLGLAYLTIGDFEHGWPEYEWRWKRNNNEPRSLSKPMWDGSYLDGKTILLHAEQGLGDTYQFIRYAQLVKERGGKIIAAVQPALIQILSLCPYLDKVVSLFDNLPAYDTQIPIVSLPYIFKTRLETIPHQIPYLFADQKLVEKWNVKLSTDRKLKIGLCWQGNSNYSTHFLRTVVAQKSIQLTNLLPLLTLTEISTYNLQKMTGEEQLKNIPADVNLHSFDADFDNAHGRFMDTAAVIKNLDLMITVDTSMAHLAGGLGIPVWVMMPEPADWRWMLNRSDTPWYPNMRIFRQPKPGDWNSVVQTIVQELKIFIARKQTETENAQKNKRETLNEKIRTLEHAIHTKEHIAVIDTEYQNLVDELFTTLQIRKTLK